METNDRKAVRDWIGDRSQTSAALELGVSQGFLSKWLANDKELSRARAAAWHDITGIPIAVLVLQVPAAA
jgi:hypothetical protein